MAFPSNTGSTQASLDLAWANARQIAGQVKATAQSLNTSSAAGNIVASSVIDYCTSIAGYYAQLQTISAIPNIASYAQNQVNNPTLDVAGSFNAMMTQIQNVIAWIKANYPQDGSGFFLERSFNADGTWAPRMLTPAQTGGLRTVLGALIATID
jgi:hypothetical protein